MLLDGNNLERLCKAGDIEARIAPFEIGHDPSISEYKPYEYIYCRYVRTVQLFLSYCLIFLFIFIIPLHIIFNLYYLASYFFLSFPFFPFFSFFFFSHAPLALSIILFLPYQNVDMLRCPSQFLLLSAFPSTSFTQNRPNAFILFCSLLARPHFYYFRLSISSSWTIQ